MELIHPPSHLNPVPDVPLEPEVPDEPLVPEVPLDPPAVIPEISID